MASVEHLTPEQRRLALIRVIGSGRPNHPWADWAEMGQRRTGCRKCPVQSPFQMDQASHLYVIEEEM